MWSDDPVIDSIRRDEEDEAWLETRPECCICGEPIQDEYMYVLLDDCYCESCINDMREYVDRYIEERRGL